MTIIDYKGELLKRVIWLREGRSLYSINSYACLFRGMRATKNSLLLFESLFASGKHKGVVYVLCEGELSRAKRCKCGVCLQIYVIAYI